MSRRKDPVWVRDVQPGLEAKYEEDCPRCPDPILKGDRIVFTRGRRIHVRCASGTNDE